MRASLLLIACATALVAACAEPGPVRFPHAQHVSEISCGGPGLPECLSCNSCHRLATTPKRPFPEKKLCSRCHQSTEKLSVTPPTEVPQPLAYTIRFNHEKHLAMRQVKGQCVPCHAGATEARSPLFPVMESCFDCHEHRQQWDRAECAPCHLRKDVERLLPQTFAKHDAGFQRNHGQAARQQQKLCQQCHTQQQCDDCHDVTQDLSVEKRRPEAIERNFVHRGNFLSRHSIEAKSQPATCARCHTPASCDGCHLERGVSGGGINSRNPHPGGWVTGSPSAHGRDARRDILSCAGCHDQGPATNCIRCHKVGAYGGNPHPKGWKSARSESSTMCRYCHAN
jgi:hypothetical protein